jgi:hypothetical protein
MRKFSFEQRLMVVLIGGLASCEQSTGLFEVGSERSASRSHQQREPGNLRAEPAGAEVVATGIPGVGAICQVGTFHLGGPFRDNAAFSPFTGAGQILDGKRLLVASADNFGAPLGRADQAPGTVLSLEVGGGPVNVPATFASAGGQASAAQGRVRVYAANNAAFSNSVFNPMAATATEVSASLPLGISLNNAFGRPWFANAPGGSAGNGTITVIDPSGAPFKGPPNPVAGGVFAGDLTNRGPGSTHGLTTGALATALLTKSPDGSGRAIFLAANADGSVVQIHVQKGVDGLAPPGSFTPLSHVDVATARSTGADDVTRVGMVFNWVPRQIVYVSDPLANRILVLELGSDGTLFTAQPRYLSSGWLNRPIDLAPTSVETAARNFASNTTLGAGSDLYVLNRGDNTIARMTQAGEVIAVRQLEGVPGMRVAGLGVSPDGRTLWVTATTPGSQGVVLKVAAFGGGQVTDALLAGAEAAGASDEIAQGKHLFSHQFTLEEAVGPLFNGRACADCHNSPQPGGMGTAAGTFVVRFGRVHHDSFDPMLEQGGPVARQHSIAELGGDCGRGGTGVSPAAGVTSRRSAMTLRGSSLIDNILDVAILGGQAAQPAAVRGRAHRMPDGRVGKFGWKAGTPTLVEFMAQALRDEMGITNPLLPEDATSGCDGGKKNGPDVDGIPLTALVAFLNTVDPPAPAAACLASTGAALFAATGCATCHTPSLPGPGTPTASQKPVRLYSDLLLHDLGPEMADGIVQGDAAGNEFRTAPLWRAADRAHFLHDGRAATLGAAISAHGGQGAAARAAFGALSAADQQALLDFLGCI